MFFVELVSGRRPVVVVSNNARNRALRNVLAAPITTAPKPALPSIVVLTHDEPVTGSVLCDDITHVPRTALSKLAGALSRPTMRRIDVGLKEALGLRD